MKYVQCGLAAIQRNNLNRNYAENEDIFIRRFLPRFPISEAPPEMHYLDKAYSYIHNSGCSCVHGELKYNKCCTYGK